MNKIRVIDLFDKKANGEKMPSKIKYDNIIFEYDGDYYSSENNVLFDEYCYLTTSLNDDIEIIEEDKKIEKYEYQTSQIPPWFRNEELIRVINDNFELQTKAIRLLIDEVNTLKEKEW